MAKIQHVYITAHGEWSSGPWVGESAQFGLRMVCTQSAVAPARGALFDIPLGGDVVDDYGSQTGAHGTLTKAWTASMPYETIVDNYNADFQIGVAEDVWTFLDTIKAHQPSSWRWTSCKIAPILADGSYGAASAVYTFTTPLAGSAASSMLPPEVSIAVSLRTPVIGRRGRGRIYIPALVTTALGGDGVVALGTNNALRGALVTLVNNLQSLPGLQDHTGVVMITSAGRADAYRPLEVRVGNHFDVQARRQHQAAESYISTLLT